MKKIDHFKNTILQNFDPKRFDYSRKLIFFKLPLGTNRLKSKRQERAENNGEIRKQKMSGNVKEFENRSFVASLCTLSNLN